MARSGEDKRKQLRTENAKLKTSINSNNDNRKQKNKQTSEI